jgi:hypothetical protein
MLCALIQTLITRYRTQSTSLKRVAASTAPEKQAVLVTTATIALVIEPENGEATSLSGSGCVGFDSALCCLSARLSIGCFPVRSQSRHQQQQR